MRQKIKHILFGLLIIVVVSSWSCSPKTLSIFFDGVPNPEDTTCIFAEKPAENPRAKSANAIPAKETVLIYFSHEPYKQKQCSSCHDPNSMGKFLEPMPQLCYQCHDDFSAKFSTLHAPVDAGECTACHNPHMSQVKYMLKSKEKDLCFSCHDAEDKTWKENHDGLEDMHCTECHNPHGGSDNFMLK